MGESFEALALTPEGLLQYYERLEPVEIVEDFWAIGQGADIALGAMAAGASPERAVEIACELNIYTGPPVVVERLQEQDVRDSLNRKGAEGISTYTACVRM